MISRSMAPRPGSLRLWARTAKRSTLQATAKEDTALRSNTCYKNPMLGKRWRRPFTHFALHTAAAFASVPLLIKLIGAATATFAPLAENLYSAASVVLAPLFKIVGIAPSSGITGAFYGLFAAIYLRGLSHIARGVREKLEEDSLVSLAWKTTPSPHKWIVLSALATSGAFALTWLPPLALTGPEALLANCLRLATFMGLLVTGTLSAVVAWHYINLIHGKQAREAQGDETISEDPSRCAYVALAAELIRICGETGRAPHAAEIELSLSQLQEAASQMDSTLFHYDNIPEISEKAVALFEQGHLLSLPGINAALKHFYRPDPAVYFEVAQEIQHLINEGVSLEAPPATLPEADMGLVPTPVLISPRHRDNRS
jgi:hypothetical protein